MADQQFFLKWNDFQTNMVTSFRHLRDEKSFTDVRKHVDCSAVAVPHLNLALHILFLFLAHLCNVILLILFLLLFIFVCLTVA